MSYQPQPFISVILPIRNEGAFIRPVLQAIIDQDYPSSRYEILIADGMSTDQTRNEIEACLAAQNHHPTVILIDNPKRIVPTGLNEALRVAKGDFIIRVDGHVIIEQGYLLACIRNLDQTGAANVGGPITCIGRNWLSSAIALATSKPYGVGNSAFRTSTRAQYTDTVPFGAWHRQLFTKIGMFNENFVRHQDYEFNHRTRTHGGKIYLTPDIRSQYFVRASISKLARQYFQYGTWKAKMLKLFPGSLKWRHVIPPAFVGCLLGLSSLALFFPLASRALTGLCLTYLVFLLAATFLSCRNNNWRYAPALPIIFATLHFSWGLGFWWGLPQPIPASFQDPPPPLSHPQNPETRGYRIFQT